MASLTARGKALRHLTEHRGITEDPPNSNCDDRPNANDGRWGIRKAQRVIANGTWLDGTAWCGTWAGWAAMRAGVRGITYRIASVELIQQDARNHAGPFLEWFPPTGWKRVLRADLVTFFGGAHVETVRSFHVIAGRVWIRTEGGNTSSGSEGSQSNGGGAFPRLRPLSDADGFARVDYPGGVVRRAVDRALTHAVPLRLAGVQLPGDHVYPPMSRSDDRLLEHLGGLLNGDAIRLRAAMKAAA